MPSVYTQTMFKGICKPFGFVSHTMPSVSGMQFCSIAQQGVIMGKFHLKNAICSRSALLAVTASLYWIWWDSFHEAGRFFLSPPLAIGGATDASLSYLSCIMRPLGIVLGSLIICFMLRKGKGYLFRNDTLRILFYLELVLHVLFYCALVVLHEGLLACVLHCAVSACATFNLVYIALLLNGFSARHLVFIIIACIASYAVVNNLIYSFALFVVPLWLTGIGYAAALFGGFVLCLRFFSPDRIRFESSQRTETAVRTPLPLAVHLLIYGLTFGILHTFSGKVASGPFNINMPTFFACLIAIGFLAMLFLRKPGKLEIWSKIRSTVFPLTIIGFLLIPLVPNSDIALSVMESGALLYDAVFLIACVSLMQRTYVDPCTIMAKGLLYKNFGMAIGLTWTAFFYFDFATFSSTEESMLAIAITLLLTIATFWVGSDEQVRKIWGLRKKLSPKQYNDAVLRARCQILADTYQLTAREHEILLKIAQGKRASEIKEEQHISINTVRSHIQHAYTKLNVHSLDSLNSLLKSIVVNEKEIE